MTSRLYTAYNFIIFHPGKYFIISHKRDLGNKNMWGQREITAGRALTLQGANPGLITDAPYVPPDLPNLGVILEHRTRTNS